MISAAELMTFSNSERSFFEDNLLDSEDWGKVSEFDLDSLLASPTSSLESEQDDVSDYYSTSLQNDDLDLWLQDEPQCFIPQDDIIIKQEPVSPTLSHTWPPNIHNSNTNLVTSSVTSIPTTQIICRNIPASPNVNKKINFVSPVAGNMINSTSAVVKPVPISSPKIPLLPNTIKTGSNNSINIPKFVPVVKSEPNKIYLPKHVNIPGAAGNTNKCIVSPQIVKLENGQFYIARSIPKAAVSTDLLSNTNVIQTSTKPGMKRPSTVKTENLLPPPKDISELKSYRRQQRMMKNRESACLSRQRKKHHMQSLEESVSEMMSMNQQLEEENEKLKKRIQALESENTELRDKHIFNSKLKENAKKSTVLFAVLLLFVFNPWRSTPDILRASKDEISSPSLNFHQSRSLLQFDNSNVNNDFTFKNNAYRSQKLPESLYSMNDLFNIKNKMKDTVQIRRNLMNKLNEEIRNHVGVTADGDIDCGEQFNKTDLNRINKALEGLVKGLRKEKKKSKHIKTNSRNVPSSNSMSGKNFLKDSSNNCSENRPTPRPLIPPTVKSLRHMKYRKAFHQHRYSVLNNSSQNLANIIEKLIIRKPDTFYLISLAKEYVILPATNYSNTHRPKVSFMLPAFHPNHNETSNERDKLAMLQIDCNVIDTKLISLKQHTLSKHLLTQLKS